MPLTQERMVVLTLFAEGAEPKLYAIPAIAWRSPNALLVDREYEGKKSAPEWGINLSKKNLPLLEPYRFGTAIAELSLPSSNT